MSGKKFILLFVILINTAINAQEGYLKRVESGFGSDYNLTFQTSYNKLLIPSVSAGLGIGVNIPISSYEKSEVVSSAIAFPMFVDVQYTPLRNRVSPFLSLQFGGENTIKRRRFVAKNESAEKSYKLVGVLSPTIGGRIRIINKFAINVKFSRHFRTSSTCNISKQTYSYSLGVEF